MSIPHRTLSTQTPWPNACTPLRLKSLWTPWQPSETRHRTQTQESVSRLDVHTPARYHPHMDTMNDIILTGTDGFDDAPATGPGRAPSYAHDKAKILARLRRVEGQVRGVSRMVENDQYCVDVLTQMSAIIAALRTTGLLVLEDHMRGCVMGAGPDDREAVLDELTGAIERFTRSVG